VLLRGRQEEAWLTDCVGPAVISEHTGVCDWAVIKLFLYSAFWGMTFILSSSFNTDGIRDNCRSTFYSVGLLTHTSKSGQFPALY
jgi:hypothetical protein